MTCEQTPQIPSRQSWSKTIGSFPSLMRSSFTTSSISRKEWCSVMFLAVYVSNRPGSFGALCRQTISLRVIVPCSFCPLIIYSSLRRDGLP